VGIDKKAWDKSHKQKKNLAKVPAGSLYDMKTISALLSGIILIALLIAATFFHTSLLQWIASAGLLIAILTILISLYRLAEEFPNRGHLFDIISVIFLAGAIVGTFWLPLSSALLGLSFHFLSLKCYLIMKKSKGLTKRNATRHFNIHSPFMVILGLVSLAGIANPSIMTNIMQSAAISSATIIHAIRIFRTHTFLK